MRLSSTLALAALFSAGLAVHADTLSYNVSADGASYQYSGGENFIASQLFPKFDPSLGTLNSITIYLNGTASPFTGPNQGSSTFTDILAQSNISVILNGGRGETGTFGKSFAISTKATFDAFPVFLDVFQGTGTQGLLLNFTGGTTTSDTEIAVAYNYTATVISPPAAVTPEPSGIALLGTGVLGMAGMVRRRML